jgi:hypothetical protein
MRLTAFITLLIVLVLPCPVALAEDTSEASPDTASDVSAAKDWEFFLAPIYLWAASSSGKMTVRGIQVDVDESFSDVVDNLDGALISHFEAHYKQRWGIFADLMYIRLNPDDVLTPIGNIGIGYTELLAELGGFYR